MKVVKRDGRTVDFDPSRISGAITKCFASLGVEPRLSIGEYTGSVVAKLESGDKDGRSGKIARTTTTTTDRPSVATPTVEQIQDLVQQVLIENGEVIAATHYIEYRATHNQQRKTRPVPVHIQEAFAKSKKYFGSQKQEFQFYDKYARYRDDLGRRETWEECVDRTVEWLKKLSQNRLDESDYVMIREHILNLKVMPAMRLLASAGITADRNNATIYNCSYLSCNYLKCFSELLLLSMSGCGVGYSVEEQYIRQLPRIKPQTGETINFKVPDTTEGWVEAVDITVRALFEGKDVIIDYTSVRPAGSVLRTKGGRASGPEPLKTAINFIRMTIKSRQGSYLSPLHVHDINCYLANAAVCGGVRRSAMICLFDFDDVAMRTCKSGNLQATGNTQRWNANNSAVWPDRDLSQLEIMKYMQEMFESFNGEPGIFNRANSQRLAPKRRKVADFGVNPCLTGDTMILTTEGQKPITDLIGKKFSVVVNGKTATSTPVGFWHTGIRQTYKITMINGESVRATENHRFFTSKGWEEVKNLKYGDAIHTINPATSNMIYNTVNSITPDEITDVYDCTIDDMHCFYANNLLSHNCGEIILRPFQFCNLTSAVLRSTDSLGDAMNKVRVAAILGTIQSMASHFPGLRKEWKENVEEERLLGVDLNGQSDFGHSRLSPEFMKELHDIVVNTNVEYATKLGINPSVATTCVKPSGNSSEFLDCSNGVSNRHALFYKRRFRVGATSPLYQILKDAGVPLFPENGQSAVNPTTWVAEFVSRAPPGSITKKGESIDKEGKITCQPWTAVSQLDVWRKNKLCYTEHNPSVTIDYRDDEMLTICAWIHKFQREIGGISFLPLSDARYNLMPYEEITEEEYTSISSKFPTIDFSKLYRYEEGDYTTSVMACDSGMCERVPKVKK